MTECVKRRSKRPASHWRKLILEWRSSGLSGREFCKNQGLNLKSLHVWSSKLKKIDGNLAPSGEIATFLPVKVIEQENENAVAKIVDTIDVYLACGDVICVPQGCDMQQFSQVVAILRKEWQ